MPHLIRAKGDAFKNDGTVRAWGRNNWSQTNVPGGLTNVVAVAAGGDQSLALLSSGVITNWGTNFGAIPASATNVIAIAAGTNFCLALRSNGTIVAWGSSGTQTNIPSGLTNVVAIAAGGGHALALRTNGTVVAWGVNSSGQTNVPSGLTNIMAIAAGYAHSMALSNNATLVEWGNASYIQTNLAPVSNIKLVAAGGYQSLISMFSPTVQYQVDVTKDLLLIYNTNSAGSSNVCAYYLANRPLVSHANVLPIGCTNTESFLPSEYTNVFVAQIGNWLAGNPTKRPQYVILFFDIPSRVNTARPPPNESVIDLGVRPSVSYSLANQFVGWQPFVTHINLGTTNDCIAYIDKLKYFGETYSPGKLVISAGSFGTYGNTNYVLDGIRYGGGYTNGVKDVSRQDYSDATTTVSAATNGLLNAGVPTNAILFFDGLEIYTNDIAPPYTHPGPQTNIGGYMSWGGHSLLGGEYPTDGKVTWLGDSRWWIIETLNSFNGQREAGGANFIKWFSSSAFGGSSYSNTPVGAVSNVDEPGLGGMNIAAQYFGLWASGKNFGITAWNSRITQYFQAVGDPLTKR